MAYQIAYHPAVLADDLPVINHDLQVRISRAIQERLTVDSLRYGEPLRHRLKGYWKLRVGDYRVMYHIVHHEVQILRIDHRKGIYALPPRHVRLRSS